jgi:general secretion pathway protein C
MGSVHHNSPMLAKTSAFLIWAAVAGAAVFWGLHLSGSAPEAPAHAQPAPLATVVRSDLGRLLGPDPASPSAESQAPLAVAQQSRFQLLGVIAAGSGGSAGWATLAVDGKPPRTFRVGSAVDGSSVLQKVRARGVEIGPRGGAPVVTLQLSPLAPAATGRPGGAGPAPAALSTGAAIGAVPGAVPGAAPGAVPGAVPGAEVPPPSEALRRPSPINR